MTRLLFFLCASLVVRSLWASDILVRGLEADVKNETIFVQLTNNSRCPARVQLHESDDLPRDAREGDRLFFFEPLDFADGRFTFEGNSILYRSGLENGRRHNLDRSLSYPAGVAYSSRFQTESRGVLKTEYYAKVFSVAMISSVSFVVYYNPTEGLLVYEFSGNGVDDVRCVFAKAEMLSEDI